jgi:hypothetical protein
VTGSWRQRRGSSKLRLLGTFRGDGELVWAGGRTPVAYALDLFGAGEMRSANGSLEGDFSSLERTDAGSLPSKALRLRLADGLEIPIDVTSRQHQLVEFDADLPPAVALALKPPASPAPSD